MKKKRPAGSGRVWNGVNALSTNIIHPNLFDENDIVRTLRLLSHGDSDAVVEVRILGGKWTNYGYFSASHFIELPSLLKPFINHSCQFYVTINPVLPALLARCTNRIQPAGKGDLTSDKYILRRRWLLVDVDPERPTGISATDDEKAAAWDTMQNAVEWMKTEMGFNVPILADSGNGYHALFPIALPNDDVTTLTIKNCLQALSQKFSNDKCKIDESVFNAARISKLYGTMAKKGCHCPEIGRPHRLSRILEVPEALEHGRK